MNKVILMGRLTADPEVRYSQSASPVCVARYSLAVRRGYTKQGEPETDFFRCVAFGKNGEFAEKYYRKGQLVAIVGHLQTNNWEDAQHVKHYSMDIIIDEQHFAESKKSASSNPEIPSKSNNTPTYNNNSYTPQPYTPFDESDEDLPF